MNVYHRKLYALLKTPGLPDWSFIWDLLEGMREHDEALKQWWDNWGRLITAIASSSDRVNLQKKKQATPKNEISVKHLISGQEKKISPVPQLEAIDIRAIAQESDPEKIFWWCWRFLPEIFAGDKEGLLRPAHLVLPDCPIHSYRATASALAGAMFPEGWSEEKPETPYLILFTFSPVQEFIKSSRKFLDFWAGSYLLHYLGAKLCWYIAKKYSPDSVITPSLWSQEIIDAFLMRGDAVKERNKKKSNWRGEFNNFQESNPISRFEDDSVSLSTAGFPNVITAIVPGADAAETLASELIEKLKLEWQDTAERVRQDIKDRVMAWLEDDENCKEFLKELDAANPNSRAANESDLKKLRQKGCWRWQALWDAQIDNTWEPYWTAVPLGCPESLMEINKEDGNFDTWKREQNDIAPSRHQDTPTLAEEAIYESLNVGTWWANAQGRLGQLIQSVKNTRAWQIAPAPGIRSTLSGQFSALHPDFLYKDVSLRVNQRPASPINSASNGETTGEISSRDSLNIEGSGMPSSSMNLFWKLMSLVYPGLFNGSEKLNAIELTKRMAWQYGGVARKLGVKINTDKKTDYEGVIRFPNLSSIAIARFASKYPERLEDYWQNLKNLVVAESDKKKDDGFSSEEISAFYSKTQRPLQVPLADKAIAQHKDREYNGVMFSSKWLADDMGLSGEKAQTLRGLVERAHRESGFNNGSPADWWAIALADGDSMGKYVSGSRLKEYKEYLALDEIEERNKQVEGWEDFEKTRKRMGPATHVGLNRALLDFSNRLVPYITEVRCCGRVVYSGGDDVMAVLPLEDLPLFLRSLRAAWSGAKDPQGEFSDEGGYWRPTEKLLSRSVPGERSKLQDRPYFTMGKGATTSAGIVIAHKSVPLPTVLESLWTAEKERAKKIPGKDGLCFRVIYGSGNTLEALMKGTLLERWWRFMEKIPETNLSPILYRLAEELPRRGSVTRFFYLFYKAARAILEKSDAAANLDEDTRRALLVWLILWERWARTTNKNSENNLGTRPEDLGTILRFSAFWCDKMERQDKWVNEG
ncbi:MAG: type III-B CRISPR-associated protein Cas10/Cmr2 [Oscillatoria sp. SIO1A7]|nr:type III-B CRISPR-associated protein Cas10/Cmr2 [Oscillatoria sp. SIO1A7]